MLINISKGWKYFDGAESDDNVIPADASSIDLPADLLRRKNRNYNAPMGISGSYYDGAAAVFYKILPRLEKCKRITLEVEGVNRFADVIMGGNILAHLEGAGKHYVDITGSYVFGAQNLLVIKVWAPQMAGRYTGAGISGGVKLHTYSSAVAVKEDGVYVASEFVNGKTELLGPLAQLVRAVGS